MDEIRGIPDTDKLILLQLDDESFSALCSVSRYTRSLCDEKLWADRFALKYGVTLWQYGISHRDAYIEFSKLKGDDVVDEMVKKGCFNLIKKLIENKGIDLLNYILQSAAKIGNLEIAKLLLDKGADIHDRNDYVLKIASRYGHLEVVRLLLHYGADIHAENDKALQWASSNGHLEVVRLLLEYGADVHAFNDFIIFL